MSTLSNAPILVTGSHRSGTTWLGKLLAASAGVGYIDEPFNLDHPRPGMCAARFPYWSMHLTDASGERYRPALARTLQFEFDWADAVRRARTPKRVARALLDAYAMHGNRRASRRPLMKDPIAFFSAEWLQRAFGMQVVVMARHPGAFAASLKRLDWRFDFHNLLDQPDLMRDHLDPYRAQIEAFAVDPPDIVDQAGLLWRCIYGTAARLRDRHPEWVFVRHEDLSLHPQEELGRVCAALDVGFDAGVRARLEATTSTRNPTDAPEGRAHLLMRNSAANVDTWRNRLTAEEISRLRDAVAAEAPAFYPAESWEPVPDHVDR